MLFRDLRNDNKPTGLLAPFTSVPIITHMKVEPNKPVYIDATGVNCPVPLMMLKQAVDQVDVDDVIVIEVTDVHAELDFEIWCDKFNHKLEKLTGTSQNLQFRVTKVD